MTIWVPKLRGVGPRYRELADAIASAIERGELASGVKLPPQRRLADALGVTVGTVTRAYREVETQGFVDARVGSGTYVRLQDGATFAFGNVGSGRESADMIDLSLALPSPTPERASGMARALATVASDSAAMDHASDYQPEGGLVAHRERITHWMESLGLAVDADDLIINQGGMNGIFLTLSALLGSGERVAAEALSYPGLISVAQQLGVRTVPVAFDAEGIDIEALARSHERQPFAALYLMPEHHNPTTVQLTEARRRALVDLARERDFWLIEDGVLYMPPEARGTPLYQLAPERTIYLFSMAKILGGGIRSGVMRVPATIRDRVTSAVQNLSWMPPPIVASAACQWIASGDADRLLHWQMEELNARQAMARDYLGDYAIAAHPCGLYVWLELPEGHRATALVDQLSTRGVRVTSAEAFCVGATAAPQAIRICISAASNRGRLANALSRIRAALDDPAPVPWQTV
ncbi:PLP-dependent aminotransferase family protein [Salinisphaera sp. USBA-960]|nr:PLP-dependent aminotransferase family protein [Salifodinibacter halophilus]NNC27213.1 PLP-dependent aminotransferase family protein [Salifodinibacter halophilus]